MALDLDKKELEDIISEGTGKLKKDFEKARQEDGEKFDERVNELLGKLNGLSSQEEVQKMLNDTKDSWQKDFDKSMAELNDMQGSKGKKSWTEAFREAMKAEHSNLKNVKGNHVVQVKEMGADNFTNFEDWFQDLRGADQMIRKDRDMFHMRDILPLGSTNKETIKYPRELDKTGTGPDTWVRGADAASTTEKPEFDANFDSYSTDVKWIAGTMRIPVEMLDDLPFLTSFLQSFARQELLEVEDAQLLNGGGTGADLSGIIPNATAYSGSYTDKIGVLVDASYGQLAEAYHSPTDLLLHPRDVVDIILNKALGSGEYDYPPGLVGVVNGQLTIAGLNLHKTTKIAQGDFLVGDFNNAQLIQRTAPQLRFFEQDRDNVVKNLITVRIEERLALAIFKENAFITGSFPVAT